MKASDLKAIWEAPDNSRLMKKQTSVRLATHIGARISALCEMFPSKTKSQLINDLLSAALHDFENELEFVPGEPEKDYDSDGSMKNWEPDIGPREEFFAKANKHLCELEKDLGNDQPNYFNTKRWRKVGEQ